MCVAQGNNLGQTGFSILMVKLLIFRGVKTFSGEYRGERVKHESSMRTKRPSMENQRVCVCVCERERER